MNCPKCGKSFPSGPKTCPFCGYAIPYLRKCPSCGWKVEPLQRMCRNCGLDLTPFIAEALTSKAVSRRRRFFEEDLERPAVRGETALVIVGIAAAIIGVLLFFPPATLIDIVIGGWLFRGGSKKRGMLFILVGIILFVAILFLRTIFGS